MKNKIFNWNIKNFQPIFNPQKTPSFIIRKESVYGDDKYLLFDCLTHEVKKINKKELGIIQSEPKNKIRYIENTFVSGAATGPLKAFIAPWGFCNLNCLGCYAGSNMCVADKIPFGLFTKIIDQLYDLGNFLVIIGGGEPLINDEIWRYIDYIRSKGMGVSLTTNGFRVDDKIISYLKYYDVRLNLSLDGTRAYHDKVRVDMSGHGTFDRVIAGINKYTENAIFPTLRYTLTELNLDDANDICDLVDELGLPLKVRRIKHGDPMLSRSDEHDLLIKDYSSKRYLNAVFIFNKRGINMEDIMNAKGGIKESLLVSKSDCGGGTRNIYINYKGDIYPCEFMGRDFLAGNIYEEPLDLINLWKNSEYFHAMRNLPQYSDCSTCLRGLDCHTECPAIVLCHNKKLSEDIVDPACMINNGYFEFAEKEANLNPIPYLGEVMFSRSWQWYDLFKSNKRYGDEVNYVNHLLNKLNINSQNMLELACGTSNHGVLFGENCKRIVGLDINENFIKEAKRKNPNGFYYVSDISKYSLNESFDVVLALYGALGYMQNSKSLFDALKSAANHLSDSGVLIIEPWFTPLEWSTQTYQPYVVTKEDEAGSKISRMSLGHPDGTIDFEYLFCSRGDKKIQKTSDSFKFGLHKTETIVSFLSELGLKANILDVSESPFSKRGLIVACR